MKPSVNDIIEINRLLGLWGHILDNREWNRLDEVITRDAVYDGSVFGLAASTGIDAIRANLNSAHHALAHHSTNVVVLDGPGDELTAVSKGIGVLPGGIVSSANYADRLVRTAYGWRIAKRVLSVNPKREEEK